VSSPQLSGDTKTRNENRLKKAGLNIRRGRESAEPEQFGSFPQNQPYRQAKTTFSLIGRLCADFRPLPRRVAPPTRREKSCLETTRPPNHLRPRREKLFGPARGIPLDGNAKARLKAFVQGYNARYRQQGQHRGPITRAYMRCSRRCCSASTTARPACCFPSYEAIAEKAKCCRDTVYEAIKVLEEANVLTGLIASGRAGCASATCSASGRPAGASFATSNAYVSADPLPCHQRNEDHGELSRKIPPGTLFQLIQY